MDLRFPNNQTIGGNALPTISGPPMNRNPPPIFPHSSNFIQEPKLSPEEVRDVIDNYHALVAIHSAAIQYQSSLLDLAAAVASHRHQKTSIPNHIWDSAFRGYITTYLIPTLTGSNDSESDRHLRMTYRCGLFGISLGSLSQRKTVDVVAEMDRAWIELIRGQVSPPDVAIRDQEIDKALGLFKLSSLYGSSYYRQYAKALATGGPMPA